MPRLPDWLAWRLMDLAAWWDRWVWMQPRLEWRTVTVDYHVYRRPDDPPGTCRHLPATATSQRSQMLERLADEIRQWLVEQGAEVLTPQEQPLVSLWADQTVIEPDEMLATPYYFVITDDPAWTATRSDEWEARLAAVLDGAMKVFVRRCDYRAGRESYPMETPPHIVVRLCVVKEALHA